MIKSINSNRVNSTKQCESTIGYLTEYKSIYSVYGVLDLLDYVNIVFLLC